MNAVYLVLDHLWQSTAVLCVLALVALGLRRKRASVRYAVWLAASLKFAVPFAALGAIGASVGERLSMRVSLPAPDFVAAVARGSFAEVPAAAAATVASSSSSTTAAPFVPALLFAIWAVGCVVVLGTAVVRWTGALLAVRVAVPLESGREVTILRKVEAAARHPQSIEMRGSDAVIEPGVFGVFRPVLVWPRSMSVHLSDDQIETILIHELSHVRRRDNLFAFAHTVVQAVYWFHPLVWWVGTKLVDERERACDEDVVSAGRDRRIYAESLLKTCQFCVGAPITSMAGVTGSDLKRRVTNIMAAPVGGRVGPAPRVALTMLVLAAVVVPVIGGAANVPQLTGTGLAVPDGTKKFDAASARQNKSGNSGASSSSGKGNFTARNMTLEMMLRSAFSLQPSQLIGGPDWLATDRFDIVAKADPATPDAELRFLIQNLLIERFALKLKVETRSLPMFALVLARADGKLGPDLQDAQCAANGTGPGCAGNGTFSQQSIGGPGPGPGGGPGLGPAPVPGGGGGMVIMNSGPGPGGPGRGMGGASMSIRGTTMASFARSLSSTAGRTVIDQTGFGDRRFDLKLRYSPPGAVTAESDPAQNAPELFTALQEQLGLKLDSRRGPVEVLVIEGASRPVNDNFEMPETNGPPPGR